MPAPLNFGSNGNPFDDTSLSGYDSAPGNDGCDLSAFSLADGPPLASAGVYVCKVERGELTKTKGGKTAYRVCFKIVEPAAHAGLTVWKWYTLTDEAGRPDRAKQYAAAVALAPLDLRTRDDLHRPFPPLGKDVFVKALVTVRPAKGGYPATNDIERFEPCAPPASAVAAPNPFAVPLDAPGTPGEGGKPQ